MIDDDPNRERESIWSVPPGRVAQYFGLFTLFASLGLGFLLWYEIFENTGDTVPETIRDIIQGLGLNAAGSAGLSLQIIEGPKVVTVLADYITKKWLNPLKEQLREEGREQGREEGSQQTAVRLNAEWRGWIERRDAAAARGEPFDEPPPDGDAPGDGAG